MRFRNRIYPKIAGFYYLPFSCGVPPAANVGSDAGDQYLWGEGLCDVVIGARVETTDLILFGGVVGDYDDRRVRVGGPELLAHRNPEQCLMPCIYQDNVGRSRGNRNVGLFSRVDDARRIEPLPIQAYFEIRETSGVISYR